MCLKSHAALPHDLGAGARDHSLSHWPLTADATLAVGGLCCHAGSQAVPGVCGG